MQYVEVCDVAVSKENTFEKKKKKKGSNKVMQVFESNNGRKLGCCECTGERSRL